MPRCTCATQQRGISTIGAFIESVFTDKRVRAVVESKTQQPMPFATCFEPQLLSSDGKLLLSSSLIKTVRMNITFIIDVVEEHTKLWGMEKHKVCVLYSGPVCVHIIHKGDDVMF